MLPKVGDLPEPEPPRHGGRDGDAIAVVEAEWTAHSDSLRAQGVEVRQQVSRGDAALVLSDAALEQKARLIVVGAGDRGKAARRILGGVAGLVAKRAPCSVLIARRGEH